MEELAAKQDQLGAEIQRIISNYKKDPQSRKDLKYYQARLGRLEQAWTTFEEVDNKIRTDPSLDLNHAYFQKDYYAAIQEVYLKYHEEFLSNIEGLQEENTPPKEIQLPAAQPKECGNLAQVPQQEEVKSGPSSNIVLIRKHQQMIQVLQRILRSIEEELSTDRLLSKSACEVKIQTINKYWLQVENYTQELWGITEDSSETVLDIEQYHTLQNRVQHCQIQLAEKLNNLTAPQAGTAAATPTVKLPKITLPQFNGDYLKWRQFKDLFTQVVHNQAIGAAQKMWYLKGNLTGDAERLIRHLPLSDANYATAWQILTDRYDNIRLLVHATITKLLSQPSLTTENAVGIKTLHDTTLECLLSLRNLGINIDNWDPLLLHLLLKKLDRNTHGLYEQTLEHPRQLQSMQEFLHFLEGRFQALEAIGNKTRATESNHSRTKPHSFMTTTQGDECIMCGQHHQLYACAKFLGLSPQERYKLLKRHGRCINCMKASHKPSECTLRSCTKCSKRHNTLVHFPGEINSRVDKPTRNNTTIVNDSATKTTAATQQLTSPSTSIKANSTTLSAQTNQIHKHSVLLSTVMIILTNQEGKAVECRAILDSGSQLNFITERMAKRLGLREIPDTLFIQGIGQGTQRTQHRVNVSLQSRTTGYLTQIEAFILPQITTYQPTYNIDVSSWHIPKNIQLADPSFHRSDRIDFLIGAEIYFQLLAIGQINLGENLPTLQNTVLGWVIGGKYDTSRTPQVTCGINTIEDSCLNQQMEKFWKLEEIEFAEPIRTKQEIKCETHFKQTVKRNQEGRFVVKLPFMQDPSNLGRSEDIAINRFLQLERRLLRNPELKKQYDEFMQEYQRLGHMEAIDFNSSSGPYYFLPHHCVQKPDSTTTKLRVVFDASAKTSTNISLNDILGTGPTIQDDLFSILLRFRLPRFVFTADIEKMYRQILVAEEDRRYQLVMWRDNPNQAIQCFRLNTVTYGTTSAPYLATKCLQQLAVDASPQNALGAAALKRDFYMDDLMTGSDSLREAIEIQQQLNKILQSAGFNLRKWGANHAQLLQGIPPQDRALQVDFTDNISGHLKTLGLIWLPNADEFKIKATWTDTERITKRSVLSDIAHLFDPLGIMSPVVITAKIFLQKLWDLKLDWDAALPMHLHTTWRTFREGLKTLSKITFPRHIFSGRTSKNFQLHAFADASEKGYGTALYVRSILSDGTIVVHLLCAKSKVAPLKPITLPRLELCAAKLACDVVQRVKRDLQLVDVPCFYWTDSEIVLAWINSQAATYHTFVANRIAVIQELSTAEQWRHVRSKDNPADLVSRGMAPEKLQNCNLWFYGPIFLHGKETVWPPVYTKTETNLERKQHKVILTSAEKPIHFLYAIDHQNSFKRLQRVVAYMLRFTKNIRYSDKTKRLHSNLTVVELEESLRTIISTIQGECFSEELQQLKSDKYVANNNSISSLTPFLDENGLIRVGGRLEASNLSYDAKHPMILPYSHWFTKLLMTHLHVQNLHAGAQTLLAITRQRYWPIKGKTTARSIVQHCVRCARSKPTMMTQLMGDLPHHRVQPARAFLNTGVDFAGPLWTHFRLRGKRPQKTYIAVFCCFSTKATHFEVVSDLTTEAFIGALKRFMGRRGHCRHLYCDNATNFVGARNQLEELKETIYSNKSRDKITDFCSTRGIDFHFIPPRAPHFGGLWEAAVKSAKYFLLRNVASATVTYEELETIIIEIEAILNSRPLMPLSSDPNDLSALTPGHFLIGEPMTSPVDAQAQPLKTSLPHRWKLISQLKHQFWQRWSNEYLCLLQQRYKWKQRCNNIRPGMMVVIKEDNQPVLKWQLGRIVQVIRGNDDLVRVADIKTSSGILRRAIHKLAPLPIEIEDETNNSNVINEEPADHKAQKHKIPKEQGDSTPTPAGPSQAPSKRSRYAQSALSLLLLTNLILPVFTTREVENSPFKSPPGLYFEGMGPANLVLNDWSLVVYYDMRLYWKEFDAIKHGISQLDRICSSLNDKTLCAPTILDFRHLMNEMEVNNEALLYRTKGSNRRAKRGALNIVGNLANALFGVLDADYAEHMAHLIDNLEGNDNYLLELIKNQTSLVDATSNLMMKSQEAIEQQLRHFNLFINHTVIEIKSLQDEALEGKVVQGFTLLAVRAMVMLGNYQRIQTALINVMIDTNHGKVNPQLLTPRQFQVELLTIKENLPPTLRLPAGEDNLLQLYSLTTIEGRITPNQMIFRLKLPLFSIDRFDLMHIVPVPMIVNGTVMTIKPSTNYLIVDLHRDLYYPLTDEELATCTMTNEPSYVCKQHHPLYRRGSNISACEVSFITHIPMTNRCKLTEDPEVPKWIQLLNPNHWIYFRPRKSNINLVCGTTVTQIWLEGSGIIKLGSDCAIKEELTTIQAHKLYPTSFKTSFIPTRNISEFVMPSAKPEPSLKPELHRTILQDMRTLHEKIQDLKLKERAQLELQPHDIHQFTVSYLGFILIIILSLILIGRYFLLKRKSTTRPRPRPRTTKVPEFQVCVDLDK